MVDFLQTMRDTYASLGNESAVSANVTDRDGNEKGVVLIDLESLP